MNLRQPSTAQEVEALRRAYVTFRESEEAEAFRYPCQGEGRVEHMLPFRPPFNTSAFHTDDRRALPLAHRSTSAARQPAAPTASVR